MTDVTGMSETDLLARAFGIEKQGLAAAPLHYRALVGRDPDGYCLFAYPVHLHPRREQLILMTGPEFELDETEISSLIASIRAHYPDWQVERTEDAMWFITVDGNPGLVTTPLQDVLGEDINEHLPRGADGMTWVKILNELQMIMFASEVNQDREAAGRPAVNSLWFWGGGRPGPVRKPACTRVVTDSPVAYGIGQAAGIDTSWLEAGDGENPNVAAPGTLWVHAGLGDGTATPAVGGRQWQVLRDALRRGSMDHLILIEPGYAELKIDARVCGSWLPWR